MESKLALTIPGPSGTQSIEPPPGIPTGLSITTIITSFLEVAMVIGILLSVFYLAYGGLFWIQSKGNKETLDKARRIIVYSIFGLIVMSLSLVVVNLVSGALGIDSLIGGSRS